MKGLFIFFFILIFFQNVPGAFANYDPLSRPNNKFGIHILSPDELDDAAKLVNSSSGDWGYVTIPIQDNDFDIVKWQKFLDNAKALHVTPIIRISTQIDYFNNSVWRKPNLNDVLDMANFLDSLTWPTANRYVIIYNEVNRGDEWGGSPDPREYAEILSYAASAFKTRSKDFFVISAGLDNAAANNPGTSFDEYYFLSQMHEHVPNVFKQIDGMGSHSYPNPAFTKPPNQLDSQSINSFSHEADLIQQLSGRTFPIFITETGWDSQKISFDTSAQYYKAAIANTWNDPRIVAVTPFLLKAGGGPFEKFSFTAPDGKPNIIYSTYHSIQKIKGAPFTPKKAVLSAKTTNIELPVRNFSNKSKNAVELRKNVSKTVLRILFNIPL